MKRKKDAEVASIGGVSTMPAAAMVPTQSPVSAPKAAWETELPEIVVSAERTTNSNIADIATADNTVEVSHDKAPTIGSVTPNTRKAVEEVQSTPRRSPRDVTLGIPLDMPTREPKANVRGNDERIRRRMGNPLAGLGKGIAQLAAMVDVNRDKRSVRSYERANERLAARESRAADRRQRDAEKAAVRESRQAERDMARQARTDARLEAIAERDAEREDRLAREREAEAIRAEERLARNAQIDARRAERRDERLANRADRAEAREEAALSRMEEREANRMARDAARDANILAREEERLARVGERNNRRAERAAIKEENAIERAENRQLREEQAAARRDAREASRAERIADRTERKAEQDAIAAERRADRAIARENAAIKNAARAESKEAAAAERSVRREERVDARAEAKDVRAQAKESQRRAVDDERRSVGLDRLNNQEMAGIGTPVDGAIDDVTIDAQRFARGKAIEEPDVAASRAARRQQEDVSPESAPISDAEARVMRGYANTDAPNSSEGGQDGAVGSNVEGAPMTDAEVASAREARGYAATPQGATKAEGNTGDSKPLTEEKTSVATENSGVDPSLWQVAAKDGDTGTVKNDRANATIEKVAEEAKKADDPLAFLTQLASQYSDEDRKADEKRKKAAQWILAAQMLGDSIGALSNVYWTGKGANAMKFEPGAQKAATATYQLEKDIREAREKAAKAQYDATLKKYELEMQRQDKKQAQENWQKTFDANEAYRAQQQKNFEKTEARLAEQARLNAENEKIRIDIAKQNANIQLKNALDKNKPYPMAVNGEIYEIPIKKVNEQIIGSIFAKLPEDVRMSAGSPRYGKDSMNNTVIVGYNNPSLADMLAAIGTYGNEETAKEIMRLAGVKVEEVDPKKEEREKGNTSTNNTEPPIQAYSAPADEWGYQWGRRAGLDTTDFSQFKRK